MRKKIAALLLILSCLGSAEAQKHRRHPDPERFPDTAEVYSRLESVPPFGIYKDNYFVTGSSFSGGKLTKNNSDAKFQISIRHRLIKGVLPFHTYLFLTYTQKSFWDIYKKSKPFAESNYNPTLGLGTPITRRDKLVGLGMLQFEHESNGRGGDSSRSWNRISLTGIFEFNRRFSGELKLWIPMGLSDNPDYVRYGGYGQAAVNYKSLDERVRLSLLVVKRGGWNLNANLRLETQQSVSFPAILQWLCRKHDRIPAVPQLLADRFCDQAARVDDFLTFRPDGVAFFVACGPFIGRVPQQSGIRNVFLRDARARSVSWTAVLRRSPGRLILFWKDSIEGRWHCAARRTCPICPFALG